MIAVRPAVAAALNVAACAKSSGVSSSTGLVKASLCAAALSVGMSGAAHAQEGTRTSLTLEEITVTGSRIRRTTDFDTPNPTTVVDAEFLQNLGIVNVGDAIKQLPSNVSNNSPNTTGNANFFAGSTIANLRGLNPFFGSRTLTLLNNRRFVPTNQGDGVDLNFIPSTLIERIDVVTGGASAAYGSGAISGVNNIFLNRRLDGGKMEVDFYQTAESDGDDVHAGLAFGTSLFGGRGHIVFGHEYQDSDPVGCIDARDWCAAGNAYFQNPVGSTYDPANPGVTRSQPAFILGNNIRANQISYGGVFWNSVAGPGQVWQANAAGTGTVPFNLGEQPFSSGLPFNVVPGGDGRSVYEYTNLRAPVKRNVTTGMFTLDVTDSVTMSVDLSYGKVETVNRTGALDANLIPLAPDNAFIQGNPELMAAELAGRGQLFPNAPAFFNKDWTSQVNSFSRFTTEVKRGAIGFDGGFGESTWTWDAYYQYGETEREQLVNDNRHLNRYNLATDAVRLNPADPTSPIVCRVTRDGVPPGALYDPLLAQGCVPLNPFGTGAISPDAYAYSFGFLRENLVYKQSVLSANVSGDLFQGFGAGPVQAASGIEYRVEKGRNIAAEELPAHIRTDFLIQYGESFSGDVDVTEAFVELNVPFLRSTPGAELLELNVAARQSHYKNKGLAGTTGETRSHDITTWKVSGVWDPVDWMRLRATQSRDIRAANFRELYYGQQVKAGGTFGFCGPAGTQIDPCNWSLEGNVNLRPEKADTTTFGFVLTPENWVPGLQFAVDYFDIEIKGAIQQANVRRVLDGCQVSGIQEFCDLLTPEVPGDYSAISDLRALAFNGSGYRFKGVDFSGNYFVDLGAQNLNFRLIATKMLDQNFQPTPGQPFINIVGQTGTSNSFLSDNQPTADLLVNFSATYGRGPVRVTGQARHVADGVMNYYGITPDDPRFPTALAPLVTYDTIRVPSYTVFALSGSYDFQSMGPLSKMEIFATIDNLFDKDPPIATGSGFGGAANGGTNPVFYDTMGRAFRVGLRAGF